jgi:hypothetical protein
MAERWVRESLKEAERRGREVARTADDAPRLREHLATATEDLRRAEQGATPCGAFGRDRPCGRDEARGRRQSRMPSPRSSGSRAEGEPQDRAAKAEGGSPS